VKEEDLRKR